MTPTAVTAQRTFANLCADPTVISLRRPRIMGIVNVTPDSFFPGSRAPGLEEALRQGMRLEQEGADVIDVGGESSRPGAEPVGEEEEARRVLPALELLAKRLKVPLSIDTYRASVAKRALECGATWLNDISALRMDSKILEVAVGYSNVVLMHMQGANSRTMQQNPQYNDVVHDILNFFRERLEVFERAGGLRGRVFLDPGIGFGKTLEHNLDILAQLEKFHALEIPLLLGASRKSFIGRILGSDQSPVPVESRLEGSLAVACRATQAGVSVLRVHDVASTKNALEVWSHIRSNPS